MTAGTNRRNSIGSSAMLTFLFICLLLGGAAKALKSGVSGVSPVQWGLANMLRRSFFK
jgi:hypothetical protein